MRTSNLFIHFNIILNFFYYSCELFLDKYKMKYKNFGKESQLLLLDVLDYIVEQGNMNTWIAVSSKKFFSFLIDILRSQNDAEIHTKLLQLIQKWGIDFQSKSDIIPNFYRVYNIFKSNGVVFPPREQSNYYKYIDGSKSNKGNDYPDEENNNDDDDEDNNRTEFNSNEFEYMESLKSKLKVSNFEHKYRRLVDYLLRMQENIKLANIFINRKEINRVREPINTLKKGNKTLIDTISTGRLRDDTLMEITLGTTEDINQTISREEEMKTGNTPNKFTSYFVLNEIFPIKGNSNKARAKSVKKKGVLNQRNNFNIMEQNNNNNNNNNNNGGNNIKNVDDIFDLFSATKPQNINEQQNNQGNNMFNNNSNNNNIRMNNFYNNSNNNFNNNDNNLLISNQFNNNSNNMMMNSNNNNFNQNNFNNNNAGNNQNFDFPNLANMQNKNSNSNEFDMYGPAPQINSNQLTQYIGPFNQNNNNNYPNFNGGNQNNFSSSQNMDFRNNNDNNNMMSNNFGNNINNNFGQQKTQEDIEREERLKELDELF